MSKVLTFRTVGICWKHLRGSATFSKRNLKVPQTEVRCLCSTMMRLPQVPPRGRDALGKKVVWRWGLLPASANVMLQNGATLEAWGMVRLHRGRHEGPPHLMRAGSSSARRGQWHKCWESVVDGMASNQLGPLRVCSFWIANGCKRPALRKFLFGSSYWQACAV